MKLKLLFVAKRMHENMKIENWKMLEMHSNWKRLLITNQTICKICLILKLHFEFNKKFVQKSHEVWLFVSKVCTKRRHPQEVEGLKVKKDWQSANIRRISQFSSMPTRFSKKLDWPHNFNFKTSRASYIPSNSYTYS